MLLWNMPEQLEEQKQEFCHCLLERIRKCRKVCRADAETREAKE